ncbi:transposase domain-containing protein [Endozoicomonas gorgoniicola]
METAKACDLEPYAYLKGVFTQLPSVKPSFSTYIRNKSLGTVDQELK